jgi:hypothetical protein
MKISVQTEQRQVFRRTRARQSGEDNKHTPRKRQQHRTIFAAGEIIPESGIYEVIHEKAHRETHESVLVKGDPFPVCETCHNNVRFRVVRVAPYIFDDEDFGDV